MKDTDFMAHMLAICLIGIAALSFLSIDNRSDNGRNQENIIALSSSGCLIMSQNATKSGTVSQCRELLGRLLDTATPSQLQVLSSLIAKSEIERKKANQPVSSIPTPDYDGNNLNNKAIQPPKPTLPSPDEQLPDVTGPPAPGTNK